MYLHPHVISVFLCMGCVDSCNACVFGDAIRSPGPDLALARLTPFQPTIRPWGECSMAGAGLPSARCIWRYPWTSLVVLTSLPHWNSCSAGSAPAEIAITGQPG
ncbi:hypothetical protein F5Y16DRAFT_375625 [Xylariaceae sp. FL0255]|nr:hypothetical protein F5Y16DRAFT_375625 [Xylariaceae sp. FL0255]